MAGDYDADEQTVQKPSGQLSPDAGQEVSCPGFPENQPRKDCSNRHEA